LELRDYLRILHSQWMLIVAVTLIGVAAAAAFSLVATPQYEAKTKLYVSVHTDSQATGDLVQGSNFARQNMATFVELATTDSVMRPVVEELGLKMTPGELAEQVKVDVPLNSTLLNITVTDDAPAFAAEVANEIGDRMRVLVQEELEPPRDDEGISAVQVKSVQPATVPKNPVSPRVKINLALGLLGGVGMGIGLGVLRSTLDTRIHSVRDIEQISDAPILGRIVDDPQASKRPLIVHLDPKSPRAEAFRTLRTNIQFLTAGEGAKSFVVSSAGTGEGKSTTSTNLALALSEAGFRVVLVDCDLRRPRVAEYMGIEGTVGLTDVLIGRAEITDVLQRWGHSQLYVLPAGQVPPNPSELLGSQQMEQTLVTLSSHVDFVILDAPPLLMVTDAAVIGAKTHGVVLVAAAGSTRKQNFEAAVSSLDTAGISLRGIVATMLPIKGPTGYGYGIYEYAYGSETTGKSNQRSEASKKASGRRALSRNWN